MKKPACAQPLSSDFSPLLFSWGSLLSTYSHTIRKSLTSISWIKRIFLPLQKDWLCCFCHFLNDLGTILKCLDLSACTVREMCKGRPMVASRAMPLCAAKPREPWGPFPLHFILLGQPHRDAAGRACASTLLLLWVWVKDDSQTAPPASLLQQGVVRAESSETTWPEFRGPL